MFIETDCVFTSNGQTFESGGAYYTNGSVMVYTQGVKHWQITGTTWKGKTLFTLRAEEVSGPQYYLDTFQDETAQPLIILLPHGRFLAAFIAWQQLHIDTSYVLDDKEDALRYAADFPEHFCELQRNAEREDRYEEV